MIRAEFYAVCDECALFLGEDTEDGDYLTSTETELVEALLADGWQVSGVEVYCPEHRK